MKHQKFSFPLGQDISGETWKKSTYSEVYCTVVSVQQSENPFCYSNTHSVYWRSVSTAACNPKLLLSYSYSCCHLFSTTSASLLTFTVFHLDHSWIKNWICTSSKWASTCGKCYCVAICVLAEWNWVACPLVSTLCDVQTDAYLLYRRKSGINSLIWQTIPLSWIIKASTIEFLQFKYPWGLVIGNPGSEYFLVEIKPCVWKVSSWLAKCQIAWCQVDWPYLWQKSVSIVVNYENSFHCVEGRFLQW